MSEKDSMKDLSKQNKNKSATRGAQLVSIGIPTICMYNLEPNKYVFQKIMESITNSNMTIRYIVCVVQK